MFPKPNSTEESREGGKERENEELQKVCEMQLQGTVVRLRFPSPHFGSVSKAENQQRALLRSPSNTTGGEIRGVLCTLLCF